MNGVQKAVAFLLLGVAPTALAEPSFVVPEDRSLSVSGYEAKGMPPIGSDWGPKEARAAWNVLDELFREDPAQLPRFQSGRSGPYFDKILREAFTIDSTLGDLTMSEIDRLQDDDGLGAALATRSLVSFYRIREGSDLLFDNELVEIRAGAAKSILDGIIESRDSEGELEALLVAARESGDEERIAGLDQIRESRNEADSLAEKMFLWTIAELAVIGQVPGCSPRAADAAIVQIDRLLTASVDLVDSETQSAGVDLLEEVRARSTLAR